VSLPTSNIKIKSQQLHNLLESAFLAADRQLQFKRQSLENKTDIIELMKPQNVLKKGFSLIKHKGKYIPQKNKITAQMTELDIEFYDGEIKVKIEKDES
jgi:exonuclease VII large subunit